MNQREEQHSQLKRLDREKSWIEEILRTNVIKDVVWSAISPADSLSNKFTFHMPGYPPRVFFDHCSFWNDKVAFTEVILKELREAGWNGQ